MGTIREEQILLEDEQMGDLTDSEANITEMSAPLGSLSERLEITEKEALNGVKVLTEEVVEVDMYDFDKTAIPFDSQLRYWGFCMLHNPWIILMLPFQFIWGVMMGMKIISVKTCKKVAFWFANFINNKSNVEKFWEMAEKQFLSVQALTS